MKEEPVVETKEEVTVAETETPVVEDEQEVEIKEEEKPKEESPVKNIGKVNPEKCGGCKKKYGSGFCGSCVLYPSL